MRSFALIPKKVRNFATQMCSLEPFKIDLKGLKQGQTTFAMTLDDAYFEAIDAPEVRHGNVALTLSVERVGEFFNLTFREKGTVAVPCDLCLDDVDVEVECENRLAAKFGEESADEGDDCVTVAENEGILDTAWLAYEFLALAIPVRHVHAPGKCNEAMIRVLGEHTAARSGEEDTAAIDPRWAALQQLKD